MNDFCCSYTAQSHTLLCLDTQDILAHFQAAVVSVCVPKKQKDASEEIILSRQSLSPLKIYALNTLRMYFPFYSALQTQITISAYRKNFPKFLKLLNTAFLIKVLLKHFPHKDHVSPLSLRCSHSVLKACSLWH